MKGEADTPSGYAGPKKKNPWVGLRMRSKKTGEMGKNRNEIKGPGRGRTHEVCPEERRGQRN